MTDQKHDFNTWLNPSIRTVDTIVKREAQTTVLPVRYLGTRTDVYPNNTTHRSMPAQRHDAPFWGYSEMNLAGHIETPLPLGSSEKSACDAPFRPFIGGLPDPVRRDLKYPTHDSCRSH